MRIPFNKMFADDGHGSYTSLHKFVVDGITLPKEVRFTPGVSNSGVDIASYVGHDLEIRQNEGGTPEIGEIY